MQQMLLNIRYQSPEIKVRTRQEFSASFWYFSMHMKGSATHIFSYRHDEAIFYEGDRNQIKSVYS
jgi:pyruvate-formate lyase